MKRSTVALIAFLTLAVALPTGSEKSNAADQAQPPNTLTVAEKQAGWRLLFDGQTLEGWKTSENPDSFTVRDGMMVARAIGDSVKEQAPHPKCHLFFVGPDGDASFTNFEFQAEVKVEPGANSGIYFHTEFVEKNWPQKGFEVQINNTYKDPRKTGSLYAVADVAEPVAKDDEWFTLWIRVEGKHVQIKINDKRVVDWTEPEDFVSRNPPWWSERRLSHGTFALQAHDEKSVVYFRNLKVKPLNEQPPGEAWVNPPKEAIPGVEHRTFRSTFRPGTAAKNASGPLRGCDFIEWDRLLACQKYGENDRLEAYPTIFSQPLRVHPTNPRYFTDGSGKAIYLTGSHTWNNLVDFGTDNPPKPFDFDAYLDFLERHHHNFFRLWRWEGVAFDTRPFPQYVQPGAENIIALHPWPRTGPGHALDGLPKFDLSQFNPDYFNRLRARVQAAGERGIYVSVMLFEGWELQHIANGWKNHPFHADNNVNGLDIDTDGDTSGDGRIEINTRATRSRQLSGQATDGDGRGVEINTLRHPAALKFQEDYVRKVIATVGDLDNVLYEICNESGAYSIEWQYHFIRFVKDCEKSRGKSHPVGMTFPFSGDPKQHGKNADLFNSPADWISPNSVAGKFNYQTNPPPALGDKVVLADTDHLGGIWGNSKWVWQSFLRGHNPIFMDPYQHQLLGKGQPNQWDSVRQALGATRRMAERMDLAQMTPVLDIASTKYCLANPGKEYLVYLPEGGEVTVDLEAVAGTLTVEWMHPLEGTIAPGEVIAGGAKRQFKAPFAGDAVLYLATRKQDL
jgi:hypothetical protein